MGYITPKGLTVSSYKSVSMLMGYCQTPQGGGGDTILLQASC